MKACTASMSAVDRSPWWRSATSSSSLGSMGFSSRMRSATSTPNASATFDDGPQVGRLPLEDAPDGAGRDAGSSCQFPLTPATLCKQCLDILPEPHRLLLSHCMRKRTRFHRGKPCRAPGLHRVNPHRDCSSASRPCGGIHIIHDSANKYTQETCWEYLRCSQNV